MERAKQLTVLIKTLDLFWGGLEWGELLQLLQTRLLKEVTQQLSYLVPLSSEDGGYTAGIHRYLPNGWVSRKASSNGQWLRAGTADRPGHRGCVCIHVCVNIRMIRGGRVQVRQVFLG